MLGDHLWSLAEHIEKLSAYDLSFFPYFLRARVSRQQHLLLLFWGGEMSPRIGREMLGKGCIQEKLVIEVAGMGKPCHWSSLLIWGGGDWLEQGIEAAGMGWDGMGWDGMGWDGQSLAEGGVGRGLWSLIFGSVTPGLWWFGGRLCREGGWRPLQGRLAASLAAAGLSGGKFWPLQGRCRAVTLAPLLMVLLLSSSLMLLLLWNVLSAIFKFCCFSSNSLQVLLFLLVWFQTRTRIIQNCNLVFMYCYIGVADTGWHWLKGVWSKSCILIITLKWVWSKFCILIIQSFAVPIEKLGSVF